MLVFLLYYKVNQLYVYIKPSLLSFPRILHAPDPLITERWAPLPVLHNGLSLAICCTCGSVYMSMLFSQFISPSPSPAVRKSLLHICVIFRPPTNRLIYTIFLSICMHYYTIIWSSKHFCLFSDCGQASPSFTLRNEKFKWKNDPICDLLRMSNPLSIFI